MTTAVFVGESISRGFSFVRDGLLFLALSLWSLLQWIGASLWGAFFSGGGAVSGISGKVSGGLVQVSDTVVSTGSSIWAALLGFTSWTGDRLVALFGTGGSSFVAGLLWIGERYSTREII